MTRLLTLSLPWLQASLPFCSFVSCTNPLSALGTLDAMICLPVSLPKALEDSKSIFFLLKCKGTGIGLVFIHGYLHATQSSACTSRCSINTHKGTSESCTHCRGLSSAEGHRTCKKKGRGRDFQFPPYHCQGLTNQTPAAFLFILSDTSCLSFHPIRHEQLPFFSFVNLLCPSHTYWYLCCAGLNA